MVKRRSQLFQNNLNKLDLVEITHSNEKLRLQIVKFENISKYSSVFKQVAKNFKGSSFYGVLTNMIETFTKSFLNLVFLKLLLLLSTFY